MSPVMAASLVVPSLDDVLVDQDMDQGNGANARQKLELQLKALQHPWIEPTSPTSS